MRLRSLVTLAVLIAPLAAIPAPALAVEEVHSYHSDITVHDDGSMTVTETIVVRAEGREIKRGIYRDFPTKYGPWYARVETPFEVRQVLRDGRPEPWHLEERMNGWRIYIGEENTFLRTGNYTYAITYRTDRQLGHFDEHDELYWNVTGHGWAFPIDKASASVKLPAGIDADAIRLEGYTGPEGSKDKHLTAQVDPQGKPHFATTARLGKHEGMTIVVGWPKGFVRGPTAAERWQSFFAANTTLTIGLVGVAVVMLYYFFAWLRVGIDPRRGLIVPLYEPPKGVSPACARYVMDMSYDNTCFSAAVLNMAARGHLTIEEKDGEYTLHRATGKPRESLFPAEQQAFKKLLRTESIKLESKNHSKVRSAIDALKNFLTLEYEGSHFLSNQRYLVPGLVLSALTAMAAGLSGGGEQVVVFLFMIVWLSGWTIGTVALGGATLSAWYSALAKPGKRLLSGGGALFLTLFSIPFVIGWFFGAAMLVAASSIWMIPLLLLLAGANLLFFYLIRRPTNTGRALMDQIEGFKMYLSTAEGDVHSAYRPPQRTVELFERYLPYAIALGVPNQWAWQFEDVLARAAIAAGKGGYVPLWYHGSSFDPGRPAAFTSGLGSAMAGAISSASTAPGSSSGFSSGGGGGGSSGGGGGGGGGGGW